MRQVGGHKVVRSIQQKNRTPYRHSLLSQCEQSLHHRKRKRTLDSLLVNNLSRGLPQCVLGKRLPQGFREGSTTFLGDSLGVIEALWPGENIWSPHYEAGHDRTRQRATTHLVTADDAGETLCHQLVLQLEGGFYSRNGTASFSVTPMNVSG